MQKLQKLKKKKEQTMLLDELRVQVALGVLHTPKDIAVVVNHSQDLKIIVWASRHASSVVRKVAAAKKELPFGLLLRLIFFDRATTVQSAAITTLNTYHKKALKELLFLLEDFPQLSLPFSVSELSPALGSIDEYQDALSKNILSDKKKRKNKKSKKVNDLDLYTFKDAMNTMDANTDKYFF